MDNTDTYHMAEKLMTTFHKQAYSDFKKVGMPTLSDEDWLYWVPTAYETALLTPYDSASDIITTGDLIVIENGKLSSTVEKEGLDISVITDVSEFKDCKFHTDLSSISLLNSAFFTELIVIRCSEVMKDPITLINTSDFEEKNQSSVVKVLIICEENASLDLTVKHNHTIDSSSVVNVSFEAVFKQGSSGHIQHIFNDNQSVSFLQSILHMYHKANVKHISFVNQSTITRHDTEVFFYEEDAQLELKGIGILKDSETFFNHLKVNHFAKNCNCSQHFKNIIDDKAVSEFSGLVYVQEGAHGVDSTQLNNNLVFSDSARVLSRPQLVIDADDVQCAHGSTIGQLNPEEIHYVRSRGLSEIQARALLIFGFIEEILNFIDNIELKNELLALIKDTSVTFQSDG